MINKIEHEEFYFGNDKVLLQKINEVVEVINEMRSNIDELMNDLFYRETINIEKNE